MCVFKQRKTLMRPEGNCQWWSPAPPERRHCWETPPNAAVISRAFVPNGCDSDKCPVTSLHPTLCIMQISTAAASVAATVSPFQFSCFKLSFETKTFKQ